MFYVWRGVQTDIEIVFSCKRICDTAVECIRRQFEFDFRVLPSVLYAEYWVTFGFLRG